MAAPWERYQQEQAAAAPVAQPPPEQVGPWSRYQPQPASEDAAPQTDPRTWGDTAADVGGNLARGVGRGFANTAAMFGRYHAPAAAARWVAGQVMGSEPRVPEDIALEPVRPYLEPNATTRAGNYASSIGEALGGSIMPGGVMQAAARGLPKAVAGVAPTLAERFLRPMAANPGTYAALDVVGATGAGAAQEAARESGAGPVGQFGAGLAGAIAPVVGVSAIARRLPALSEATRQRLGIRLSADGGEPMPGVTPKGEDAAYRILADDLLRSGVTPNQLDAALVASNRARTFHSQGTAQNVAGLMDVDESLMRLSGALARQNPEAARIISHFLQARQTGRIPLGTTAEEMAQRGLPTRENMAPSITGAQARDIYGSAFGAAQKGTVAMGQRERVSDMLRRALLIRDAKSHGHLPSAYETRIRIETEGKKASDQLYGAFRSASEGYNPGKSIQGVVERYRAIVDNPATDKTTAELLERGLGTLYRNGKLVSSMDGLDGAQRALRGIYESADSNTRRVLGGLRRDLVDAADSISERGIGDAYQAARRSHYDTKRMDEIYDRFLREQADVEDLLGFYRSLRSDAERKVARLARWEHYDNRMSALKPTDNATKIFKERDFELLGGMIPRSQKGGAAFADRPQRVGRYLAAEQRMVEARDVAKGGSSSMRNAADDEALATLQQLAVKDTLDTVNTFVDVFRGSQSLWHVGQRIFILAADKAFGMRAEAAIALAHMLATANPMRQAQIIERLGRTIEADRMQRFNAILNHYRNAYHTTTGNVGSAAGLGAAPTGPVEPAPPRP